MRGKCRLFLSSMCYVTRERKVTLLFREHLLKIGYTNGMLDSQRSVRMSIWMLSETLFIKSKKDVLKRKL